MDSIRIQGGIALQGKVHVQGSKNAALPVLAATLLARGNSFVRNCPKIADVYAMISLLQSLGCTAVWRGQGIFVNPYGMRKEEMSSEAVSGMRSSLCLLGALLGKYGEVVMKYPGGCVIGERPIDLHMAALGRMGVEFFEEDGLLHAVAEELHGSEIWLPKPSVGATENVILAGVMAGGDTILHGAAREPEIEVLCGYLKQCGADIEGEGTDCIAIHGGCTLCGTEYEIPADRIVAGTYLLGCIGIGGSVFLEGAPGEHLEEVVRVAERMGGRICVSGEGIFVQAPEEVKSPGVIRTDVYPGFPTDLQSVALVAVTVADRETRIEETIFENRFRIVEELKKLGACVELAGRQEALVHPVHELSGSGVTARELRGGAALVVAGLMARGETVVGGCPYIDRGYENICRDFRELGARIISV